MNEKINLCEILKDCPKGTKLYSTIYGCVEFDYIQEDCEYPIVIRAPKYDNREIITSDGRMHKDYEGECTLFPSRELRDWSKFKVKKPKFDPKTLNPFEKVLVRDSDDNSWCCDLFSHIKEENIDYKYVASSFFCYRCCIPYNEDTKHLVGTTDEAPEYYKYWEE